MVLFSRRAFLKSVAQAQRWLAAAWVGLQVTDEKSYAARQANKRWRILGAPKGGAKAVNQNQRIKALVFDAYGTLFDVHSVVSLCEEIFPGQGQALSQMWRTKQLEYSWLRSVMGHYEDFWQVTQSALDFSCKALALSAPPVVQTRLMEAYLHLQTFPEVSEALMALSAYPKAILSNGTPNMLKAVVNNSGLGNAFNHIISVDAVKIYKPNPRVYGLAAQTLGVDRKAIGFVSSNCWDDIGAKAFGFRTFWVNRADSPVDELGFTPDVVVKTLRELLSALG